MIQYHKQSSIWRGIKVGLQTCALDVNWIVGRHSKLSFWNDNWLEGRSLSSMYQIPQNLQYTKNYSVGRFISGGEWQLPENFDEEYREIWEKNN